MSRRVVILLGALGLCACGGGEPAGPAEGAVLGAFGALEFTAEADAEVGEGENEFRMRIDDAVSGEPFGGASLAVSSLMRSMGHAPPDQPVVRETEEGLYVVEGVVFTMPGTWEVRYRADRGEVRDEAAFVYEVR
jgi:hypothetical protein